jgi:hypothetical protein
VNVVERELVDEAEIGRVMAQDARLRQRFRSVILLLIPNKWGARGTLFRFIDRVPRSSLYAMRERTLELLLKI